jgi:divalent metal cation (Fe/Co/Zn/Cd) transporter
VNEPKGAAAGTSLPLAVRVRAAGQCGDGCTNGSVAVAYPGGSVRDAGWLRAARQARLLAWASLAWMCAEGAVGLWQGFASGSIALTGWALGSAVEGLASVIVIWRFTGSRTLSGTAERRAQRAVAISFWLLAPYVAAQSAADLLTGHHSESTPIGIALTAVALLEMPLLGLAKHRLGQRLGSGATTGEGTQNYLCAGQAAAVLLVLAVTTIWAAGWWLDPAIGLAIAAVAVREGASAWHGEDCSC